MIAAILQYGDYNVIAVDWSGGSGIPYYQATANTRLVGAEIALLVDHLQSEFGLDPREVHIVGHSLGAHVSGYAGERITNLGRITGLDPADPYFQNTDPEVRLDPTDASFVDVIHTDAKQATAIFTSLQGFGAKQPMGHLDFYPNSGENQPGCSRSESLSIIMSDGLSEALRHMTACNHNRAIELMIESFRHPHSFMSYKCNDYEVFNEGKCIECKSSSCTAHMGMNATGPSTGEFYLQTTGNIPYNLYHYEIEISLSKLMKKEEYGDVFIQLSGSRGSSTGYIKINKNGAQDLVHGTTYRYLLATETDVGDISQIGFKWECYSKSWNPFSWCSIRSSELLVDKIRLFRKYHETSNTYCVGSQAIASKLKKYFADSDIC